MSVTSDHGVAQASGYSSAPTPAIADPRVPFFNQRAPTWDSDADDLARTLDRLSEGHRT